LLAAVREVSSTLFPLESIENMQDDFLAGFKSTGSALPQITFYTFPVAAMLKYIFVHERWLHAEKMLN